MDEIFKRRSIRKYQNVEIPTETIEKIIMAGMAAPSAGNEQPWQFIIVDDKTLLTQITEVHPYANMLKTCPGAIIVCGDLSLAKYEGFWIQDCSAAAQNMLIEAVHLGLGAVWLGIYPMQERVDGVKKIFNLPEHVIPLAVISLGFPAENPSPTNRFRRERIHHNGW